MRRLLAILLALSFSFPLLPSLASAGAGDLPACCRRDGKHQCGMAAPKAPSGELAFTKGVCAQFPSPKVTTAERDEFTLSHAGPAGSLALAATSSAHPGHSPILHRLRRAAPRGPPSLL